ncbi:MAG: mechanosensitive ion channel family protein [Gaiellaceae bacterium]
MPLWHRLLIAAVVVVAAAVVAKLVDRRMSSRPLPPGAETRYRVLRRTIMTGVITIGFFSALLTIPQVRAVAGGLLASSAVLGLIVGFASQRTLGNFVAGLLIAFAQPLRLGDRVRIDDVDGICEEIGLTYTFIRVADGSRLVIPNEKLASDTIRNSTIRSREKVAQITVQVPLVQDVGGIVDLLRSELHDAPGSEVYVSDLAGAATIVVRADAGDDASAIALERELRVRVHRRLRAEGIYA